MKKIRNYLLITFGFIIVAISAVFFLIPNKIAGGGVMGLAIILNSVFPWLPVGIIMFVLNLFLITIAMIFIGSKFGLKTIYASLGVSGTIFFLEKIFPKGISATSNLVLAAVFGTLISGIGMGIVFNQNASTGGTDIVAKLLNKYLHFDIGKALLLVDSTITLISGVVFGADRGMFALLSVLINGFVIDSVIDGFKVRKQIMIISSENEKIKNYIMNELIRGCTLIKGETGYSGKDTFILYTVLSRREFIKLKEYIAQIDRNAFITITEAREVLGEGFNDIVNDI